MSGDATDVDRLIYSCTPLDECRPAALTCALSGDPGRGVRSGRAPCSLARMCVSAQDGDAGSYATCAAGVLLAGDRAVHIDPAQRLAIAHGADDEHGCPGVVDEVLKAELEPRHGGCLGPDSG